MNLTDIEPSLALGANARIVADDVRLGRNIQIGDDVTIEASHLCLGDDVRIGSHVTIRAETFEMGCGSSLEAGCQLGAIGAKAHFIRLGEHSLLAHDTKVLVPVAVIGDYTAIHNHGLLNGRRPLLIGHNVWVGQNCVLNAEADLTIGNHVGIGAYSSVYTHGYFGDLLEGSQVFKVAPVTIEDDVWILGSYNVISPGVTLGAKALVLTGSNVTKSVPPNHTVGGAPARDLTDRMVPYRAVPPEEKLARVQTFVQEYLDAAHAGRYTAVPGGFRVQAAGGAFRILFAPVVADADLPAERPLLVFTPQPQLVDRPAQVTVFDLSRREYTRTRSAAEVQLIKFLRSYRARFVPADQPRVTAPAPSP